MDTTRIEVIGKQIEKIADFITQHPVGLPPGEIALIAAAIGASAAILAQFVIFFLTRFKEKINLKRELVADERRIAFLLTEYYKELVMHKVHKQYWYKASEIHQPGTSDGKDSHERHFISNQRSFESLSKIRVTMSDYFKVVTLFTNLTGRNEVINQTLSDIKNFKPRKASDFPEVSTYEELLIAQAKEEAELNNVYLYYSGCFDKINVEMTKKM